MPKTCLITARQHFSQRRAAKWGGHVSTGEADAVLGNRIDMRRGDVLAPLATEVGVTEVIRHDDHDIGLPAGFLLSLCGRWRQRSQNAKTQKDIAECHQIPRLSSA